MARQAAAFEVGARPFAAMVEEAEVVVFAFERLDFALDEPVQFGKVRGNFRGNFEIHGGAPGANVPEAPGTLIEQAAGRPSLAQSTQTGRRRTNPAPTVPARAASGWRFDGFFPVAFWDQVDVLSDELWPTMAAPVGGRPHEIHVLFFSLDPRHPRRAARA